jgi:membrane peptidoglycan carboxypeptidase
MPATQLVALLLAFVLIAGAGGVLGAGLFIPLAAGASTATDNTVKLFDSVPDELQPGPLSQASTVLDADGKRLATFYAQNRIVVPLDKVSDNMKNAVIAIEDERFYEHGGIDPRGITRAFFNNLAGKSTQGASTLTQQYVKNVLIDKAQQDGDPFGVLEARKDTLERKLKEAKLAISLEKSMPKDQILQGYLNVAQFGKNNIYGVETAAHYFFNKPAKDLTPVEAATIAGVTKAPSTFDPTVNPKESQKRRDIVLNKMYQFGYIDADTYEKSIATPIKKTLHVTPVPTGCQSADGAAFFCDYVIKEIMTNPEFGKTQADRLDLLYRGGLKITTTLSRAKQKAAEKQVMAHIPTGNDAGLDAVLVSVEPGTGKILSMAQNKRYNPSKTPKRGETSINYAADFVHGGSRGFQPGSNFKPFVLADWLKEGHTLNETVNATKVDHYSRDFHSSCGPVSIGTKAWSPANTEGSIGGRMTVLKGTFMSINTAFVDMGTKLDLCSVAKTAWNMGFRPTQTMDGTPVKKATFDDMFKATPSAVIGTQQTSPVQLAAAFATLASNGTYCEPIAITKVVKADGKKLRVPSAHCNPNALPSNIASTVVSAMEKVLTEPFGTAHGNSLAGGRPAAGKTGTSQLSAQTWFTGFTPQISTTAWVGESSGDRNAHHFDFMFEGRFIHRLYGATLAAPMWKDYMNEAVAGMPVVSFPGADPALVGQPPKVTPPTPDHTGPQPGQGGGPGGGGDQRGGHGGGSGGGGGKGGQSNADDAEARAQQLLDQAQKLTQKDKP